MARLKPGDRAPKFALPDQRGDVISLADYRGRKFLVYFYPKADTSGCTAQACSVRDARGDLAGAGVDVLGLSPDPPARQAAFDAKYSLGFPLLSDADHRVAEAYGVWAEKSMYGRTYFGVVRSAFLVDERGRIEDARYRISPRDTVPFVLSSVTG